MTKLSPTAEAVLDAALPHMVHRYSVAAALRAAADQVVPEGYSDAYDCCLTVMEEVRAELLTIADELEANL